MAGNPGQDAPDGIAPGSRMGRIGQIALGAFNVIVGGGLVWLFTVAVYHELYTNDFFAVGVCALLIVFGAKLALVGCDQIAGRQRRPADPDPVRTLWEVQMGDVPYPPNSRAGRRRR